MTPSHRSKSRYSVFCQTEGRCWQPSCCDASADLTTLSFTHKATAVEAVQAVGIVYKSACLLSLVFAVVNARVSRARACA